MSAITLSKRSTRTA